MRALIIGLLLAGTPFARSVELPSKVPTFVGKIYIVGNDVVDESTVLAILQLYPGQVLLEEEIRNAEERLAESTFFATEDEFKPRVSVLASEGEFKDLLVFLKETEAGVWRWRYGFLLTWPFLLLLGFTSVMFLWSVIVFLRGVLGRQQCPVISPAVGAADKSHPAQ